VSSRRLAVFRERTAPVLYPILAFALIAAIWEVWVRVADVSPYILPPPSRIARELVIFDQLWPDLWATMERVLYGFLLAVGIGFVLAVGIVTFRPLSRALMPLIVGTQVIPKIAIAPLLLVWFGYGGWSTILIVFLLAFFPIVINTTLGLRSVELEKLYLASSIGAGWGSTFFKIRFPGALPSIFGGLKLAALLSVNGAVVAEFISATSGVGRVLQTAAGDVDLPRLFVAIGYLSLFGLAFFLLMELLERITIPWHVSRRDYMVTPANEATL
jgi:NitT/TauT family transport system permease protein